MYLHSSNFIDLGDMEMHVTEWGVSANPALVLWHGLARTGRDFDELAHVLSQQYFVLCPDTIGRGLSSWAINPALDYTLASYERHALAMLDAYGITNCHWLGTSLGGLIGMSIASGTHAQRLSSLIINDIGPELPTTAIERIVNYVGAMPIFSTVLKAEHWLREVYAPFGPASDNFWRRMAQTSVRRMDNGTLTLHYDPAIVGPYYAPVSSFDSWQSYASINLPTHLLRGEKSDLLTIDIVKRMMVTGPRPGLTQFAYCGHAPSLSNKADIASVKAVLDTMAK